MAMIAVVVVVVDSRILIAAVVKFAASQVPVVHKAR